MDKRIYVIMTAPLEVIGLTVVFAAKGFCMALGNIRDAWRAL